MSVRSFNGSSWLAFAAGNVTATGAMTIAALARPTNIAVRFLTQGYSSGGQAAGYGFELGSSGTLGLYASGDVYSERSLVAVNEWQILTVSKGAAAERATFRRYSFNTPGWVSEVGSSNSGNASSIAGGTIRVGQWGGGYFYVGELAAIAMWATALPQATVASLSSAASLAAWANVGSPVALWLFNQSAPQIRVPDLVGTSHQSGAATGTTVVRAEPPIPYGISGAQIASFAGGAWLSRPLKRYGGSAWRQPQSWAG